MTVATAAERIGETAFEVASEPEVVVTRSFAAPRALVFDAWTRSEHLTRWMLGPDGWSMPVCEVDLRVGGSWRFVWRRSDGDELAMRGVYLEVVPSVRLVHTENWGGDFPETQNTLALAEAGGLTRATYTIAYPSRGARDAALATGMRQGLAVSYDRLARYFSSLAAEDEAGARELVAGRWLDAPPARVFEAVTRPELVRRWWGCASTAVASCEMDVREGGSFRIVLRDGAGRAVPFAGAYRAVVPGELLVFTGTYHGEAGAAAEAVHTLSLTPERGGTRLTETVVFASREARDGQLAIGMARGMAEAFEQLARVLAPSGGEAA